MGIQIKEITMDRINQGYRGVSRTRRREYESREEHSGEGYRNTRQRVDHSASSGTNTN